jgi:hypothetical protein
MAGSDDWSGTTCDCGGDDEVLAKVKIEVWRDNKKWCRRWCYEGENQALHPYHVDTRQRVDESLKLETSMCSRMEDPRAPRTSRPLLHSFAAFA